MASGPTVGEGDGAREKQRFTESKVYTRKAFKGPKKTNIINNANTDANTNTDSTATALAAPAATPSAPATTPTTTKDNNINGKDNIINKNKDNNINENEKNSNINVNERDSNNVENEKDSNNVENEKDSNNVENEKDSNNVENQKDTTNHENQKHSNNDENKDTNSENKHNGNSDENDENSTQPPAQTILSGDGNSAQQQQLISQSGAAASDDSSSLNRQEPAVTAVEAVVEATIERESQNSPAENGVVKPTSDSRIKLNFASRSKQDKRELRRKLESELDLVRSLVKRIEAKQGQIGGVSLSHVSVNDGANSAGGGLRRVHSEVASVGLPREPTRPLHQLSISVLENSQGMSDIVEKEKRTPKANQFYRNSEFLLAKDKIPPAESNKKSKLNGKKHGGAELGQGFGGMGSKFFKSCSSLLEKLMKHKHSWVFNEPVDAAKLGLHDYHIIIKHPMDLGTIKSRLNKNWYKSPKEFAEDVRLTFHNAMTYNPQGQDVHVMAEQLSRIFEDRWAIIESDYNREMRFGYDYGVNLPTPTPRKAPLLPPPPLDMRRILDRSESISHHADPKPKPMTITPRTPAPKKPKAKDPHKRDMTYDEKQKLSTQLQSLPSEKLDAIIQIIKRRNSSLFQHDDEIEVDIDSVDTETLWELDRFVTNYKKSLSKHKRKAEMQARAEAEQNVQQQTQAPVAEEVPKQPKTDERIVSSSTPIQGDNQGDNRSRSSSSSSSSSDSGSSSSDSDSDSSSASGSDAGSPRT
ncbi:transcription factor GTE4-like [Pyrus ussuriensis x Pyrus communis]|uniref:Transcription factor GTE4-like n=1 Tax=Pyrus ussuriensis x Pyrus communis TaxID=2448454 RepID=A0A5N5GFJ9_9ROSA|nr:transcription factor GTE4-like [Pyrus ussuriensis x Pyrus communis]